MKINEASLRDNISNFKSSLLYKIIFRNKDITAGVKGMDTPSENFLHKIKNGIYNNEFFFNDLASIKNKAFQVKGKTYSFLDILKPLGYDINKDSKLQALIRSNSAMEYEPKIVLDLFEMQGSPTNINWLGFNASGFIFIAGNIDTMQEVVDRVSKKIGKSGFDVEDNTPSFEADDFFKEWFKQVGLKFEGSVRVHNIYAIKAKKD